MFALQDPGEIQMAVRRRPGVWPAVGRRSGRGDGSMESRLVLGALAGDKWLFGGAFRISPIDQSHHTQAHRGTHPRTRSEHVATYDCSAREKSVDFFADAGGGGVIFIRFVARISPASIHPVLARPVHARRVYQDN